MFLCSENLFAFLFCFFFEENVIAFPHSQINIHVLTTDIACLGKGIFNYEQHSLLGAYVNCGNLKAVFLVDFTFLILERCKCCSGEEKDLLDVYREDVLSQSHCPNRFTKYRTVQDALRAGRRVETNNDLMTKRRH